MFLLDEKMVQLEPEIVQNNTACQHKTTLACKNSSTFLAGLFTCPDQCTSTPPPLRWHFNCVLLTLHPSVVQMSTVARLHCQSIDMTPCSCCSWAFLVTCFFLFVFHFFSGFWLINMTFRFRVTSPPDASVCAWHHLTAYRRRRCQKVQGLFNSNTTTKSLKKQNKTKLSYNCWHPKLSKCSPYWESCWMKHKKQKKHWQWGIFWRHQCGINYLVWIICMRKVKL